MVTLEEHRNLGSDEIREAAIIYKKETSRPLTQYQKRMNEAAQELCLKNPGYIMKRKKLMEDAREKIIADGFQFVKGKSRSKKCQDPSAVPPTPKRQKTSQTIRDQRLKDIEEDCKDIDDRIRYKERRIFAYENVKDYKKCDEVKEEVTSLKRQRRELQAERRRLQKSNSQSKWYRKRKSLSSENSDSRSTTPDIHDRSKRLKHLFSSPETHGSDGDLFSPVSPTNSSSLGSKSQINSVTPPVDSFSQDDSLTASASPVDWLSEVNSPTVSDSPVDLLSPVKSPTAAPVTSPVDSVKSPTAAPVTSPVDSVKSPTAAPVTSPVVSLNQVKSPTVTSSVDSVKSPTAAPVTSPVDSVKSPTAAPVTSPVDSVKSPTAAPVTSPVVSLNQVKSPTVTSSVDSVKSPTAAPVTPPVDSLSQIETTSSLF